LKGEDANKVMRYRTRNEHPQPAMKLTCEQADVDLREVRAVRKVKLNCQEGLAAHLRKHNAKHARGFPNGGVGCPLAASRRQAELPWMYLF
jgi:hypothetical protein